MGVREFYGPTGPSQSQAFTFLTAGDFLVHLEWYLCMCCMGLDVPLRASGVGNRFHVPHLMARLLACSDKSARLYGFGVFGGITDRIHLVLGSSTGWFWVVHPQAGHIRATHLVLTRNRPRASMLRVGDP